MKRDGWAATTSQRARPETSSTQSSSPLFLRRLESVRGLAALCVAICHTMSYLLITNTELPLFEQPSVRDAAISLISGFIDGETAVIVFFVISGVVIGRSLDARRSDFASFMVRRVFRLYPAHVVATLGIVALGAVFLIDARPIDFASYPHFSELHAATLNGEIFNPLRIKSVGGTMLMATWSLNVVVWSLYAEVCAAPFLPVFHKLSRKRTGWVDLATLAALLGLFVFNWDHLWSRYLFVFYFGMLVETRGIAIAAAIERVLGGTWGALGFFYLLLVFPNTLVGTRPPWVVAVEAVAAFGIVAVIVRSEGRPVLASLESPVLRWNGRLSYSFYLWHYIILVIAVRALYARFSPEVMQQYELLFFFPTLLITVAIAIGVAQLSYRFVEVPFIRLGRAVLESGQRLLERRTKARSASGQSADATDMRNVLHGD